MKSLLTIASILMLGGAVGAGVYMTQTSRPVSETEIQFCPKSANEKQLNYRESQEALDLKFCRYKYRMVTRIWDEQNFSAKLALPEGSFKTRLIPANLPDFTWFYYSIGAAGMAIIFAKLRVDSTINDAHNVLEGYKTKLKLDNTRTKNERRFVKDRINLDFDIQRVQAGLIDDQALVKERQERQEVQDSMHSLSLTEIEAQRSELLKKIAENQALIKKADKSASKEDKPLKGKESVIEMLKNHEGGWLWEIMNFQKPVWVTGEAGSGKSTMASAIVFCRQHLLGLPLDELIDPHYGVNKLDAWKYLKPKKVLMTDDELIKGFLGDVQRWKAKCQGLTPVGDGFQILVDEFTNHSQSSNDDIVRSCSIWMRSSLTDPRKSNEYICGVAHYLTNIAMGNAQGTSEARKKGLITIERKTRNGKVPLSKAKVTGLYDDNGELLEDFTVTIPDWFQCKKLAKMLEIDE